MAFIPFFSNYGNFANFESLPHRLLDQDFGLPMTGNDLLTTALYPSTSQDYYRPWKWSATQMQPQIGSTIKNDRTKFVINLDVQHFAPEEISVKTADGFVVIEGKHEEKKDQHGLISRHFTRRYALPDGTNPDLIESKLSSDGVLTIVAPRLPAEAKNERAVPIAQTGPVRKEIKETNAQASSNGAEN